MEFQKLYHLKLEKPGCSIVFDSKINVFIVVDQCGIIYFIDEKLQIILLQHQIECKSEVWSLEIKNNLYSHPSLLVLGSALGVIYTYSYELDKSNNEPQNKIIKLELKWMQKTSDMVTKLQIYEFKNKTILVASSLDKTIRVLDIKDGKFIWGQIFLSGITTFEISQDENKKKEIIAGSIDGSLRIYNCIDGAMKFFTELPNNIRIIKIINGPMEIKEENIELKSKKIILCGCDDCKIYFVDGYNGAILTSINQDSYIWYSKLLNLDKNSDLNNNQLLISNYTFDFMEGLIQKEDTLKSNLKLYNLKNFEEIWRISHKNIQCLTEIFNIDGENYIGIGTTEKSVDLVNLDKGKIVISIETTEIINNIVYYRDGISHNIAYLDDDNNFETLKINE